MYYLPTLDDHAVIEIDRTDSTRQEQCHFPVLKRYFRCNGQQFR